MHDRRTHRVRKMTLEEPLTRRAPSIAQIVGILIVGAFLGLVFGAIFFGAAWLLALCFNGFLDAL
jgi:hypothetical protein